MHTLCVKWFQSAYEQEFTMHMEKQGNQQNPADGFRLNGASGYFQHLGVDVMAFDDIYPEGHQSGVSVIMHGNRVATNGTIRFEQTPGQWQPIPKQGERKVDEAEHTITTTLAYPDASRHLTGFNPMIYPDFSFEYTVTVKAAGPLCSGDGGSRQAHSGEIRRQNLL